MVLAEEPAHPGGDPRPGDGHDVTGADAPGSTPTPASTPTAGSEQRLALSSITISVVLAVISGVFLLVLGGSPPGGGVQSPRAHDTAALRSAGSASTASADSGNARELLGSTGQVSLPSATTTPVAAPASVVSTPLAPREDFAFAPYWTLAQSPSFDLTGLSTIAYFAVDVDPDGSLDQGGAGWEGLQSQALVDLITRAHEAGERVVLTVDDFDQNSLDALTSSSTAAARLSGALIPILQSKSLDGVNFDFEGQGDHDQAGLTASRARCAARTRNGRSRWTPTPPRPAIRAASTTFPPWRPRSMPSS